MSQNIYIDILKLFTTYQWGYMVIIVVLWIMVVFIKGQIHILLGGVVLMFNDTMTIVLNTWNTCLQESLFRPNIKQKQPALLT